MGERIWFYLSFKENPYPYGFGELYDLFRWHTKKNCAHVITSEGLRKPGRRYEIFEGVIDENIVDLSKSKPWNQFDEVSIRMVN